MNVVARRQSRRPRGYREGQILEASATRYVTERWPEPRPGARWGDRILLGVTLLLLVFITKGLSQERQQSTDAATVQPAIIETYVGIPPRAA